MNKWVFKVFLKNKKENEIVAWLESQPPKVQAKIRTRISYLEITQNWPEQYVHKWVNSNLFEIRTSFNGIQYRLLGFFGPGEKEFTLLIGATKRKKLEPEAVIDIAEKRRKLVKDDRGYIDDFV